MKVKDGRAAGGRAIFEPKSERERRARGRASAKADQNAWGERGLYGLYCMRPSLDGRWVGKNFLVAPINFF